MSTILANLSVEKKMAVMQLGYQLIVSAAGRPLSSADDASIDIILSECTPSGNEQLRQLANSLSTKLWNEAILYDPFESFRIVSSFTPAEKDAFKYMMLKVANRDNSLLRMDILSQIFKRTQIY